MFDTVLIANRGEIAVRITRTLRRLGVRSVAVYSDADAGARHVREADVAVRLGPANARESYLSIERLLEAAARTGAQAVHPGYGFLAENTAFATACAEAGLVFVGPPPSAVEVMGDKIRAKQTVSGAGVPVVPGRTEPGMTDADLLAAADEVGFPVLVKDASLGGTYPVMCVTLMNPKTGGVFASFGAHPSLEVALERSLTELLQGRSFEGLNDLPQPTFASNAVTEPYNFVEHFIDSSGVVSWRFFSAKADFDFVEWDFSAQGINSNAEEAATLLGILEEMGKEVYTAVYDELGAVACRILVPGYSEIYPVEDLVWDNTNKALLFRDDILNLHRLDDDELAALLDRLENNELDEYSDIATLIGIEFDENTEWGQLTVHELKLLIHLALQQFEEAHELVGAFLQYNDNTVERRLFYQALNVVLEVLLDDDLELDDYVANFRRMYGNPRMDAVLGTVDGSVRFYGLTPTSTKLEGLDRHHRLIDSYKKLHKARGRAAAAIE